MSNTNNSNQTNTILPIHTYSCVEFNLNNTNDNNTFEKIQLDKDHLSTHPEQHLPYLSLALLELQDNLKTEKEKQLKEIEYLSHVKHLIKRETTTYNKYKQIPNYNNIPSELKYIKINSIVTLINYYTAIRRSTQMNIARRSANINIIKTEINTYRQLITEAANTINYYHDGPTNNTHNNSTTS